MPDMVSGAIAILLLKAAGMMPERRRIRFRPRSLERFLGGIRNLTKPKRLPYRERVPESLRSDFNTVSLTLE